MTNHHDPLAAAVRRLVEPFRVPTLQDDARLTVVDHDPLLKQLRGAIVGGTGHHPGGATSEAHTRLPFDAGAQAIYANIERIVRTWHRVADLRPAVNLEGALVDWYRHYRAQADLGRLPEGSYDRRAARVERWCEQIEALFDPPTLVPLRDACPRCSRNRVVNAEGEHVLALVVEYWKVGERVTRTNARCRGSDCAAEWPGWNGVSALMEILDARTAEHVEGEHEHAHVVAEAIATGPVEAAQIEQVLTGSIPVIDKALLAAAEIASQGLITPEQARASFDDLLRGDQ